MSGLSLERPPIIQPPPVDGGTAPRPQAPTPQRNWMFMRRRLVDQAAAHAIRIGGLAIIGSILAICLFLFYEVAPLFTSAQATLVASLDLPGSPGLDVHRDHALMGLDDSHRIAYAISRTGLAFVSLTGDPPPKVLVPDVLQQRAFTASARGGAASPRYVVGTDDGYVIPFTVRLTSPDVEDPVRQILPRVNADPPVRLSETAIAVLAYRMTDAGGSLAFTSADGRVQVLRWRSEDSPGAGLSASKKDKVLVSAPAPVTALALDRSLDNLYVGTAQGDLLYYSLADRAHPILIGTHHPSANPVAVTALQFLLGDRSLAVGTADGQVSTWVHVHEPDAPGQSVLVKTHSFDAHHASITDIAPSTRNRGFLTADAEGTVLVHYATSGRTLLRIPSAGTPVVAAAYSPKGDAVATYGAAGRLSLYEVRNPHPEVTMGTLFGKVWYEGYDQPAHVWQSSSGSDDFEPKYGLAPLAFGTVKGTCVALLIAVPIAILAAIFTSQFMHPHLRTVIKPTIEIMAALPTVVLGFLAGLWLAPLLDRLFPAFLTLLVTLPVLVLSMAALWRRLPTSLRNRMPAGTEALLLIPLIIGDLAFCYWLGPEVEQAFFGGHFKLWLSDTFGVRYDQRNTVVVGLVMGFAVVPIIYSISEEALSNVPRNLVAGSLALGATRWQTVRHLVLLAASPGIFSAVMIGLGRAVGETMIVLMATGNTPIMDWSFFDGFRTLSANIAVEMPEAPHGGTLYRILFLAALLLFITTFVINTVAEVVRQRLRTKHSNL